MWAELQASLVLELRHKQYHEGLSACRMAHNHEAIDSTIDALVSMVLRFGGASSQMFERTRAHSVALGHDTARWKNTYSSQCNGTYIQTYMHACISAGVHIQQPHERQREREGEERERERERETERERERVLEREWERESECARERGM